MNEYYRIATAVSKFSEYSSEIEQVLTNSTQLGRINTTEIKKILNGETTTALESLVPITTRKEAGIFFTSSELANRVANNISLILSSNRTIIDAALGAGNLLLACTQFLPIGQSVEDTLALWSKSLLGFDIFPEFVQSARLRLTLAAVMRHNGEIPQDLNYLSFFQGLKEQDVFSKPLPEASCIIVNPPFGSMLIPNDCKWASGKVQTAAWYIDKLLSSAPEGQHLVAILPDVLNSGSRYIKWRQKVASLVNYLGIEPAGRFDSNTDVDVFILHVIKKSKKDVGVVWPQYSVICGQNSSHRLAEYFNIHVGAVVPHRDKIEGKIWPYIHSRTASAWQIITNIQEERKSSHTTYAPPFVVVRRTSSPSDRYRCLAAIVNETRNVAVENHLLVLQPKDMSLQTCKKLLRLFKEETTNEWFNNRIRCRHLTVSVMSEFPCFDFSNYEVQ
jgi:hypothetical protein